MRRLRATLARSPLDREVATHLMTAERALIAAMTTCRATKAANPIEEMRQRRVLRDLERAAQAVASVGSRTPRYNVADPDLNPDPTPAPREKPEASSPGGDQ